MEPLHTDFPPILALNAPDNARKDARTLTKAITKLDRLIDDIDHLPETIMRTLFAGGIATAALWVASTTAGAIAAAATILVVAAMIATLKRSSSTLHTLRYGGHTHIVLPADFHDSELNEQLQEAEANGELLDGITYQNNRISDDLGGTVAQISALQATLGADSGDLAVTAAFLARAIHTNEKARCRHALAGRIGETIELTEQIDRQRTKLAAAVTALRQQVEQDRRTKAENAMLRWEAKQEIGATQPIAGRNEEALLEAQLSLRTPQAESIEPQLAAGRPAATTLPTTA